MPETNKRRRRGREYILNSIINSIFIWLIDGLLLIIRVILWIIMIITIDGYEYSFPRVDHLLISRSRDNRLWSIYFHSFFFLLGAIDILWLHLLYITFINGHQWTDLLNWYHLYSLYMLSIDNLCFLCTLIVSISTAALLFSMPTTVLNIRVNILNSIDLQCIYYHIECTSIEQ